MAINREEAIKWMTKSAELWDEGAMKCFDVRISI